MGIKNLMKLIEEFAQHAIKNATQKNYFNRVMAIDISMALYQFLISVRMDEGNQLTNADGEVTSHLQGLFTRTIRLMNSGIKPLYVFDGKPPEFKGEVLTNRKHIREEAKEKEDEAREEENAEVAEQYARRSVRVTPKHNNDARTLLTLMGVPFVDAAGEAEAQCAFLTKNGRAWGVGSEDMDSLTFGATILVRNLTTANEQKFPLREINLGEVLKGLQLNMDEFVDLCILCGCDYCGRIRNCGYKKAYEWIKKYRTIEGVLKKLKEIDPQGKRFQIPDNFPYQTVRALFKAPDVNTDCLSTNFVWGEVDEAGLIDFLVTKNSFNPSQVQTRITQLKNSKKVTAQTRLDMFIRAPAGQKPSSSSSPSTQVSSASSTVSSPLTSSQTTPTTPSKKQPSSPSSPSSSPSSPSSSSPSSPSSSPSSPSSSSKTTPSSSPRATASSPPRSPLQPSFSSSSSSSSSSHPTASSLSSTPKKKVGSKKPKFLPLNAPALRPLGSALPPVKGGVAPATAFVNPPSFPNKFPTKNKEKKTSVEKEKKSKKEKGKENEKNSTPKKKKKIKKDDEEEESMEEENSTKEEKEEENEEVNETEEKSNNEKEEKEKEEENDDDDESSEIEIKRKRGEDEEEEEEDKNNGDDYIEVGEDLKKEKRKRKKNEKPKRITRSSTKKTKIETEKEEERIEGEEFDFSSEYLLLKQTREGEEEEEEEMGMFDYISQTNKPSLSQSGMEELEYNTTNEERILTAGERKEEITKVVIEREDRDTIAGVIDSQGEKKKEKEEEKKERERKEVLQVTTQEQKKEEIESVEPSTEGEKEYLKKEVEEVNEKKEGE